MRSTFLGFESVRKALMANQKAQEIVSQNIANMNTEGYSRQRVELASLSAGTANDKYALPKGELQGLGVEITGITQIRDQFLDIRYRENNSNLGKVEGMLAVLQEVENALDEVSTEGLHARLNNLYKKLQDFAENPESIEFATVFRSAASKVVQVLNQYAKQLEETRQQSLFELGTIASDLNNMIKQVAEQNKEIRSSKIQGFSANELLDERNLILDKLSGYANIKVINHNDGSVSIKLGDAYLLDAQKNDLQNKISVIDRNGFVDIVWENGGSASVAGGQLAGYVAAINGNGVYAGPGEADDNGLKYFQTALDKFATKFAEIFNSINDPTGVNKLFTGKGNAAITAATIKISDRWQADANFITTSTVFPFEEGRNDNLLRFIDGMNKNQQVTPYFKGTLEEFAASLNVDVAVEVSYLTDLHETSEIILLGIDNQRESIKGVSLDEEAMNIVRFQKSYAAAARVMTALDDMLDTLINNVGLVGR